MYFISFECLHLDSSLAPNSSTSISKPQQPAKSHNHKVTDAVQPDSTTVQQLLKRSRSVAVHLFISKISLCPSGTAKPIRVPRLVARDYLAHRQREASFSQASSLELQAEAWATLDAIPRILGSLCVSLLNRSLLIYC
jgi:hypothetical protein